MAEGEGLGEILVEAERPGYKEFGDRKLLASSPAMYAAMLKAITDADRGLDRLDDLRGLSMPALVIVGDQDAPFLKPSRRMAEAIPDAELAGAQLVAGELTAHGSTSYQA